MRTFTVSELGLTKGEVVIREFKDPTSGKKRWYAAFRLVDVRYN